jgi:hypothetical protein
MKRALPLCLLLWLAAGCVRRERVLVEHVIVPVPSSTSSGGGAVEGGAVPAPVADGRYVLVGADDRSEGYSGDTPTSSTLPVLCLRPAGLADPGLTEITRTPGGSLRRRWSGAEVALSEPVVGSALTSRGVADDLCATRFGDGWRMAEFHDGGGGAGFDFWAQSASGDFDASRFWVAIDDQSANPWNGPSAMTWRLLDTAR